MSAVTHVLDTSALLAHFFDEPGAAVVQELWTSKGPRPGICAVTVAELRGRLSEEMGDGGDAQAAADAYLQDLTVCLDVDRAVAELAWHIRAATPQRLPLVDALIAATARAAGAILVHKDPHMARIPGEVVRQIVL
ncbi:MAG: PIN domain-containing protein [Spirochaetia bacterium]